MNRYIHTFKKILDNEYNGVAYLYQFTISGNRIIIKLNVLDQLDKEKYLQFIKNIFKYKECDITLCTISKFDISFKRESDSLYYLDKIEIFQ